MTASNSRSPSPDHAGGKKSDRPWVIGRDESCDCVLTGDGVSRRHAQIRRSGGTLVVEDLGSSNGTFVNGQAIVRPTAIRRGDVVAIAEHRFELTTDGRLKRSGAPIGLTVEARGLTFDAPNRRLLEDVSLSVYSSEFVGLMGPSGAGKTTLMNLMNGYLPPSVGNVLVNGRDLYHEYARCGALLGYVPQDDIMHRDLTVRQALRFTGRLRLPPNTTDQAIDARIESVVRQLQIEETLDVRIGTPERKGISGGQRKRVNLAMELLTDPAVLFLDEPTSGLSSEDTLTVMTLLRGLADGGKCIILTLHQPSLEAFRLMHLLIVVARDAQAATQAGRTAYFGPAYPDAICFFNPRRDVRQVDDGGEPSPDEVLRGVAQRPAAEWAAKYRASEYWQRYVHGRAGTLPSPGAEKLPAPLNRDPLRQCLTLIRRNLAIKRSDGWNSLVLLAQAPIIVLFVVLVFGQRARQPLTADNWVPTTAATATTIFLLCLSSIWFGCSNAAREIVGEWGIYRRERMVNLQLLAYILSKFFVGGLLCAGQCAVLLLLAHWGCGLRGPLLSSYLILMTAALTGVGIGLIISALARTQEIAMALLPMVLIPMVIFGGSLLPVHSMQAVIRPVPYLMPTRHAFEALLLSEAARKPLGPSPYSHTVTNDVQHDDPDRPDIAEAYLPENRRLGVAKSAAALAFLFCASFAAVLFILRFRDVH